MSSTLILPPEIRTRICEWALRDTVISIVLDCVKVRNLNSKGSVFSEGWYFCLPQDNQLRHQLNTQKNAIALLFTSKTFYSDLQDNLYSQIRLHLKLPSPHYAQVSECDAADHIFLRSLYGSTRLRSLLNQVAAISAPIELRKAWKSALTHRQLPFAGLRSLLLFDRSDLQTAFQRLRAHCLPPPGQRGLSNVEKAKATKLAKEHDQALSLPATKVIVVMFGHDGACEANLSTSDLPLSCSFMAKADAILDLEGLTHTTFKPPQVSWSTRPCSCCLKDDDD